MITILVVFNTYQVEEEEIRFSDLNSEAFYSAPVRVIMEKVTEIKDALNWGSKCTLLLCECCKTERTQGIVADISEALNAL